MLRFTMVALVLASGCGRINFDPLGGGGGDDQPGGGDGGNGSGDGGGSGMTDAPGPGLACTGSATPNCPTTAGTLTIFGTSSASGPTHNRGDGLAGSCGGAGAHEYTIQYLVQQSGTFRFRTTGSDFDTVLYVRDGTCAGPELACNDNFGGTFTSQITLALTAGQNIFVIVDGANGRCGNFSLTASL